LLRRPEIGVYKKMTLLGTVRFQKVLGGMALMLFLLITLATVSANATNDCDHNNLWHLEYHHIQTNHFSALEYSI
jgi:hypothetical protein